MDETYQQHLREKLAPIFEKWGYTADCKRDFDPDGQARHVTIADETKTQEQLSFALLQ